MHGKKLKKTRWNDVSLSFQRWLAVPKRNPTFFYISFFFFSFFLKPERKRRIMSMERNLKKTRWYNVSLSFQRWLAVPKQNPVCFLFLFRRKLMQLKHLRRTNSPWTSTPFYRRRRVGLSDSHLTRWLERIEWDPPPSISESYHIQHQHEPCVPFWKEMVGVIVPIIINTMVN